MLPQVDISICIITYNQEGFIGRALDSALMQRLNCAYEIIVCDDHSTDNTPAIIAKYASSHPGIIKPYYASANLGMLRNWEKALKLCTGNYIALLEGDDFWNDPLKLQKQFDILESHPEYTLVFTNATNLYDNGEKGFETYVTKTGEVFTTNDLLEYNFIPTCTVLMRNRVSDSFFHPAYFKSPFADWIIHILNSKYGKLYFLNQFTSTYQIHGQGVWNGIKKEKQLLNKLQAIKCVEEVLPQHEFSFGINSSKRLALQNICQFYKHNKQWGKYFNYRLKLFFV